jgi:membrane protein DedA with SNARE-associated domain
LKSDSPDVEKAKSELEQAEKLLGIIQAALRTAKVKDRIWVAKKHLDHVDTQEVLPNLVPISAGLDELVSSQSAGGSPMTGFEQMLAEAAPWLHRYGYTAVAVAVMLEGIGIPLPGVILMGGAALLAGRGEMSLTALVLTAWLAAAAGDNLGYWIGRGGGRRLLLRAGVSRRRLVRFDGFFRRYGIWLILFGRFFDGTRQLDGLVAGSARMPWPRFALADIVGAALWVSTWALALYDLDRHAVPLHQLLAHINPWVAGTALVVLASTLYWLFRRSAPQPRTLHVKQTVPVRSLPPEPRAAGAGRPEPSRRKPWTSKHSSNP